MARNKWRAGKFLFSENCGKWLHGCEKGAWQARDDYKKAVQEMELDAEFNEIACISDFKMLTLALPVKLRRANCRNKLSLFDDTICFAVRSLNALKK